MAVATTKELQTKCEQAYEEWKEATGDVDNPDNINPRIIAFTRKVILGCKFSDTRYLVEVAKEFTDVWETTSLYKDLLDYLDGIACLYR